MKVLFANTPTKSLPFLKWGQYISMVLFPRNTRILPLVILKYVFISLPLNTWCCSKPLVLKIVKRYQINQLFVWYHHSRIRASICAAHVAVDIPNVAFFNFALVYVLFNFYTGTHISTLIVGVNTACQCLSVVIQLGRAQLIINAYT